MLAAVCFAATFRHHYAYPFDSAFIVWIGSAVAALVYVCTLLVTIQLRGDFGVLIDDASSEWSGSYAARGKPLTRASRRNDTVSTGNLASRLISLPVSDMQLVWSMLCSGSAAFGNSTESTALRMYMHKTNCDT